MKFSEIFTIESITIFQINKMCNTQTCLCNMQVFFKAAKMNFYKKKKYIYLIFALGHRLWVYVITASLRRF